MANIDVADSSGWVRLLYFSGSKLLIYGFVLGLCLLYIFVYVHTPLTIGMLYPHDDGFYMSRGRDLAEGRWLGPYNEYTLMKGPGYPAFLALTNWVGIPVSWSQALLQCTAVTGFVAVCRRFVKSLALSALLFVLLLWHPFLLTTWGLRILRETIYPAQVLLFLAVFAYALFIAESTRQRVLSALVSGAVLGWIWLTREEGVWLLPGIAIMVVAAALRSYPKWRPLVVTVGLTLAVFAGVQIGFAGMNWWAYGKFIGVDFKERNFQRALKAIHSVVSGGTAPFVSVTRAARERIYVVSPTFKSLAASFDGPPDQGWTGLSCRMQPVTCGEIGAGWFLWAMRGAAAARGHYISPKASSRFFGRIANEISAGCARGELECNPQLISAMPQVTRTEIAAIPAITADAIKILILTNPPTELNEGSGDEQQLDAGLRFLNYPLHTQSQQITQDQTYSMNGWYLKSGREGEWISAQVRNANGVLAWEQFDRRDSPDWAAKLPKAVAQRYTLRTRCSDDCILELEASDGVKVEDKLSEIRARAPFAIPVADGTFYVESIDVTPNAQATVPLAQRVGEQIRIFILMNYAYAFLPVLALGVLSFLGSTLLFWWRAPWNVCYVMALTCWTLVASRLSLLIFISATSMPVVYAGLYHSAAFHLLVAAAVLSIAALIQLAWGGPNRPPIRENRRREY